MEHEQEKVAAGSGKPLPSPISVIIPCYNMAPWVERCVYSVLRQEGVLVEVIAVNDCSTDNTGALLDALASAEPRLKVLHLPVNVGLHAARRAGFREARHDLIGFIDSDDHIPANMYARLAEAMERTGADMALGGWRAVDENGGTVAEFSYAREQVFMDDLPGRFARFQFSKGVVWNKLYRRAVIAPAMAMELDRALDSGADYIIGFGNFMRAGKVVTVPGATYYYVQRGASMSNSMDRAKAFAFLIDCYTTSLEQYAGAGTAVLDAIDASYRHQLRFPAYSVTAPDTLLPYRDQLSRALGRMAAIRPQSIAFLVQTFHPEVRPAGRLPVRYHLGQVRQGLAGALRTLLHRSP